MTLRFVWNSFAVTLLAIALWGCAQTVSYTPEPVRSSYSVPDFDRSNLKVVVRDLRAEREGSEDFASAIQNQVLGSLNGQTKRSGQYVLTIDVIEHRSFFTLGNWNAVTKLRWRIQRANGSILSNGDAVGDGHRSNMLGYATAQGVSQDAYNTAMADLLSSLSAIPSGR